MNQNRDILKRLADSSCNESSHELQCRCFDAAEEISRLRERIQKAEHWAKHAMLMYSSQNKEILSILAVDKETGVR